MLTTGASKGALSLFFFQTWGTSDFTSSRHHHMEQLNDISHPAAPPPSHPPTPPLRPDSHPELHPAGGCLPGMPVSSDRFLFLEQLIHLQLQQQQQQLLRRLYVASQHGARGPGAAPGSITPSCLRIAALRLVNAQRAVRNGAITAQSCL